MTSRDYLCFYINDVCYKIAGDDLKTSLNESLLDFIRGLGLTGTKYVCGEGGCGACTVVLLSLGINGETICRAVNSCIYPLPMVDGMRILTIEGIGTKNEPHPIQTRLTKFHGTQCGYCSPGFVMAMYAHLVNNPNSVFSDLETALDGNLCRCTGYRPILDAFKSFGADFQKAKVSKVLLDDEYKGVVPHLKFDMPSFPSELRDINKELEIRTPIHEFYKPATLEKLLEIKERIPKSIIIGGNTELFLKQGYYGNEVFLDTSLIQSLKQIVVEEKYVRVGGSATIACIQDKLGEICKDTEPCRTKFFRELLKMLKIFAGRQIRNVATIAGGVVNSSPISDLLPILIASRSVISLRSSKSTREVNARDWQTGYKKVNLKDDEIVECIRIPFTTEKEHTFSLKVSRRKEDDLSIVNCCFYAKMNKVSDTKLTSDECMLVYGGMAIKCVNAERTAAFLCSGLGWDRKTMQKSLDILAEELYLPKDAPGGMIAYRRIISLTSLRNFILSVLNDEFGEGYLSMSEKDMLSEIERPVSEANHEVEIEEMANHKETGKSYNVESGLGHTTGDAQYVDDIPIAEVYHGALLFSEHAHAKILNIDANDALAMDGVISFVGVDDIPGHNLIGAIVKDEEVFVRDEALCIGSLLGVVVAKERDTAKKAAKKVKVTYEILPEIITIKEAIEQKSFLTSKTLVQGNAEEAMKTADHVIEYESEIGGQEHFYLETQVTVACPGEDDEMKLFASTQNPTKTQMEVAAVLGIPSSKVVCETRRMGGAFGGKEDRSVFISCAAAVAANKVGKPVKLRLDRLEDMQITGGRHAVYAKCKIGFSKEGKLVAGIFNAYTNAGCTYDLSVPVVYRLICHLDSTYYWPNIKITGTICKTNLPSMTAYRGFGAPQGMLLGEEVFEKISACIKAPVEELRKKNFYQNGNPTPYHQKISDQKIGEIWDTLLAKSDYQKRKKDIEEFNASHTGRKKGISLIPLKFGISFNTPMLNQSGALIQVYLDGHVLVSHGGTEMGQGLNQKVAQICADCFRIPLHYVRVCPTTTDKVPNTTPTSASVGADLNGAAAADGCQKIMKRLEPLFEKYPGKSWKEICQVAFAERISLSATGYYATPGIRFDPITNTGNPFRYYTWGAAVCEAEISTQSGFSQLNRCDILMDMGRSINPAVDIGQIEGGFVQGCGWLTLEELIWDKGRLITNGAGMYKIPAISDVPVVFNTYIMEKEYNKNAIVGSKGVGEPPLCLASAYFFAIKDAIRASRLENGQDPDFDLYAPATIAKIRYHCGDKISSAFSEDGEMNH